MNWSAIAAGVSVLTFLLILIGGGVMWGTLTERVSGLGKRADGHDTELTAVDGRLNRHDIDIAMLKEWKDGYNAAARVGGHTAEVI